MILFVVIMILFFHMISSTRINNGQYLKFFVTSHHYNKFSDLFMMVCLVIININTRVILFRK